MENTQLYNSRPPSCETMVGIEVATMVASMANKKITNMTPVTARLRFEPAL